MPHPAEGRVGLCLGGGEVFAVRAGNVREGDLADFFLGEVFEKLRRLHMGQFTHKQVHGLLQERLEVFHRADIRAVGEGGVGRLEQEAEGFEGHGVFGGEVFAQLVEVAGGMGRDANLPGLEGAIDGLKLQLELGEFLKNIRGIKHAADGLGALGGEMHWKGACAFVEPESLH